ncbi:MAG TPA: prephenate dehydrogenase/arogenate dehydrogenase family protein, partial [Candidatus Faecousia faecipullorum]|nr:prephenate dehydrogenase/arogenate dehydrogenase family protein [Candidatus Faecousia faecipullorum]
WLEQNAPLIRSGALVIDCCGIKREICARCFPLAEKYGFTFVGGHPMAGSQFSGFKYSRADLFEGAPMVLVPPVFDDMALLDHVKKALTPCHFGSFSVTTAEDHDKMIAFTSQMPHILSNAFIKSPTALGHKGFSAGSYKDLTRVAWLNPQMWAELFLENKDNVLFELDQYLHSLQAYRDALAQEDMETLVQLLDEGKRRKEEVDG